jgi:GNAT superfamily N-acetyltransferase
VEFLLILLVLAVAIAIVASPLRDVRRRSAGRLAAEAEHAALEAAKEAKYREIRDAELDHRTGKLSAADWRDLDATLRAEALELLSRIEGLDAVAVRAVAPDDEAARRLLDEFGAAIAALYPGWTPGAPPPTDPAEFGPPGGRFLVAYRDGGPIGCGGLRRLDPHSGEIKRLYVAPAARGRGVARRLLDELEAAAREIGYHRVRLDTGAGQPDALALFRGAGYEEIEDYNGNPFAAHWLEKDLAGRAAGG